VSAKIVKAVSSVKWELLVAGKAFGEYGHLSRIAGAFAPA
jgi:hypothetical protein